MLAEKDRLGGYNRIAKNTLLLYFRMLFVSLISLYTSRIILRNLGVEDYGIYNIVGGVVSMFGFLNTAMSASTQRYITFYIGKGDVNLLRDIFSNCILVHLLISFLVLFFAETIGLWFFYEKMVLPIERVTAAFWVYQCSVISTIVIIMSVPYNSEIIAHERMSVFAYISILEVTLKLLIAYLLSIGKFDKLIIYAVLLLLVQCLVRFLYGKYCNSRFEESVFRLKWQPKLLKEMLAFGCWNLWGSLSYILYTQGVNIVLNLFFGPVVNAARGIAIQVQNAINQFAHGFQTAINPQITKSYASNDINLMHILIYKSSRITFLLLWIFVLPMLLQTDYILKIWLGIVPDWTVIFIRLMLCIILIDAVANPLMVSVAATGKVRLYQFVIGGIMTLIVPSSYLFLKLGYEPPVVFWVHLFFSIMTFIIRLIIIKPLIYFEIQTFLNRVIIPCLAVCTASWLICKLLENVMMLNAFFCNFRLMVIIIDVIFCIIVEYLCGLTPKERNLINMKCRNYLVLNKRA